MASKGALLSKGYKCRVCHQRFHNTSQMCCCDFGHIFCQTCYKREYYTGKDPVCPFRFCKSTIYSMDRPVTPTRDDIKKHRSRKMFPEQDIIADKLEGSSSKRSLQLYVRGVRSTFHSLTQLSRKPVHCPYSGCEKTVAISAVEGHFKYEHKSIACISTCFETRIGLDFDPYAIKPNEKLCIILINLHDAIKSTHCQMGISNPILLVMATRIPHYQLYRSDESDDEEDNDDIDEEDLTDTENCEEHNRRTPTKTLLWIASNISTKSKYTLAVSTLCKSIRIKYVGPVPHMNDDCVKLCETGKGLILNEHQFIGMTNNGKKFLTMDIIMHSFDDGDN